MANSAISQPDPPVTPRRPTVGVLALQGDVAEHVRALDAVGAAPVAVRRPEDLGRIDGLVIPGGESTTMGKLARIFGVLEPLRAKISAGLPVFGTCAGMIMLADRLVDGASGQETFGGLDITVRRNAFGRQVDSFETNVGFRGLAEPVPAVFIRAPWVEQAAEGVEVLAEVDGHPVAVRQGRMLATSFHPEMDEDHRIHDFFVAAIVAEGLR